MGVSGCGKSTIGERIANRLGIQFIDGDALHPPENIAKMAASTPLSDANRWPWLATIGRALSEADQDGLVVACSALKRVYRDAIRAHAPDALFLLLQGSSELLASRMQARGSHFMPIGLLESQLATLEPLEADERGAVIDITAPINEVLEEAVTRVVMIARHLEELP
jgi:beta-N-acetylhexosaminidase